MKTRFPNTRTPIYVVLRVEERTGQSCVLDSFASHEACEDRCNAYTQEFVDKNIEGFYFQPQLSYFYSV